MSNKLNICALFALLLYLLLSLTAAPPADGEVIEGGYTRSPIAGQIKALQLADSGTWTREALDAIEMAGYDTLYVILAQDYGELDSHTIVFRDISAGVNIAVISELPKTTPAHTMIKPRWRETAGVFETINNTYHATVTAAGAVDIVLPFGDRRGTIPEGARLSYAPVVTVKGTPVSPIGPPVLLSDDYFGAQYYKGNCIVWDYGTFERVVRQIEGRLQGRWVFHKAPAGDVIIRYNQAGDIPLQLGAYAIDADTELFTPAAIAAEAKTTGWPVVFSDTLEVNPDADPEASSVDGHVRWAVDTQDWATGHDAGNGTTAYTTNVYAYVLIEESAVEAHPLNGIQRAWAVFDTSPLPDNCNIESAVLSLYGAGTQDVLGIGATFAANVYSGTLSTAPPTNIVVADYNKLKSSTTPLCDTAITKNNWAAAYNAFTLNAAGIQHIKVDGATQFSIRESAYDVADSAPPWKAGGGSTYMRWYTADQGGVTEPKLVITYSTSEFPPTLTTGAGTDVSYEGFTGHGIITDVGTGTPSVRGFCWSDSGTAPTTADSTTSEAWLSGTGSYSLPITGLTPSTIYYYRAYAITSVGTGYGASETVRTPWQPPTVTTGAPTDIVHDKATGHGTIAVVGSGSPSVRGLCWIHTGTPTTDDWTVSEAWASGTGSYSLDMLPLSGTTTYYVRAYAIVASGSLTYGNTVTFKTLDVTAAGGGCTTCEADVLTLTSWLRGVIVELSYWAALLIALAVTVAAYYLRSMVLQFMAACFWFGVGLYIMIEPPWDNVYVAQFFAWPCIAVSIYLLFMLAFQLFAGRQGRA